MALKSRLEKRDKTSQRVLRHLTLPDIKQLRTLTGITFMFNPQKQPNNRGPSNLRLHLKQQLSQQERAVRSIVDDDASVSLKRAACAGFVAALTNLTMPGLLFLRPFLSHTLEPGWGVAEQELEVVDEVCLVEVAKFESELSVV